MTGLVNAVCKVVHKKFSGKCLTKTCSRPGCGVSLKDAPSPRLIIDFDKPGSPLGQRDTRCDFLFGAEDNDESGWVAPLELKSGRVDASEVLKQLRAGARVAEEIVPQNAKVNFRPVLAYKGIPKAERTALKSKVRFRNQTEALRLIKCGSRLTQALLA